ncbi:hypothetical protein [Streptomyces sp. NPDC004658]|uniref:hypothetical protein n=1 Tax=Streptomyces sp. NPDC004658 TaxID=3154672 RepID=UPI0033B011F8
MTSKPRSTGRKIAGHLAALSLEMPPAAWIAVTGTVPAWARIWLASWLTIWLVSTVVTAAARQAETQL